MSLGTGSRIRSLSSVIDCNVKACAHEQPQINEMHQRKEIPIIVGGTAYWIQHLLFPNRLSKQNEAQSNAWQPELLAAIEALPQEQRSLFEDLPEEPPSAKTDPDLSFTLHALLGSLDPPIAQRWHWKDTRKVLHNLNIVKNSRRRASDIIAEQGSDAGSGQPRCVGF